MLVKILIAVWLAAYLTGVAFAVWTGYTQPGHLIEAVGGGVACLAMAFAPFINLSKLR